MKRALYLLDTLEMGGAEKSLLAILPRLRLFKPVVVVLYKGLSLQADFISEGIEVISLNQEGKYQFNILTKRMIEIVREVKPVLIHSTLFRSDIVSRKL